MNSLNMFWTKQLQALIELRWLCCQTLRKKVNLQEICKIVNVSRGQIQLKNE